MLKRGGFMSKPRLYRGKNAEVCVEKLHYKFRRLSKDELYVELLKKFEEKSKAPLEKMEKHLLRGVADVLQISKDILVFLERDYEALLNQIKFIDKDKAWLIAHFKEKSGQIAFASNNLYEDIVEICSLITSLAKQSGYCLSDIENERVKVENEDGSYLNGFLIWELEKK